MFWLCAADYCHQEARRYLKRVILTSFIMKAFGSYHAAWVCPVNTNICITFVQCWTNVEDVGPTLYKCYTNVLCFLGEILHPEWDHMHRIMNLATNKLFRQPPTLECLFLRWLTGWIKSDAIISLQSRACHSNDIVWKLYYSIYYSVCLCVVIYRKCSILQKPSI